MKNRFLLLLLLMGIAQLKLAAQNIGINSSGSLPDPSAMLDVNATNKGMLVPRMTTAQRVAITTPASGLLVFDNTTTSFWFYAASAWKEITTGSNGWNITGNTGTDTAVHFIGTTDDKPFRFRLNDIWAG